MPVCIFDDFQLKQNDTGCTSSFVSNELQEE